MHNGIMPRFRRRKLWLWACVISIFIFIFVFYREPVVQEKKIKFPWQEDNVKHEKTRNKPLPLPQTEAAVTKKPFICNQIYTTEPNANEQTEELWRAMNGGKFILNNQTVKRDDATGKLQVFIIPHSHVDPGWLNTFEEYSNETDAMLNNMVEFMPKHPHMSFIWTVVSFFEKWWKKASNEKKIIIKSLIKNGKLEMCSGGWVMTDEANPYFPASVDNLIEGQQYLFKELGVVPKIMWSNDPFGYGATVPYIFRKAGLEKLVINRIHHRMKSLLLEKKEIPFVWRQFFVQNAKSDVLTSLLPYAHYDIPNSCGPDSSICCQFDFKRLTHFSCGGPKPVKITKDNVKERAETLVDQYKKMASMFRAPVILSMLGDDFRYNDIQEWYQQHDNYIPLFNYINSRKDWNIEAKFGTFSDYFGALEQYLPIIKPPLLTGDFFPYSDVGVVWTGYFTTRPHYKRNERILQHHLRAADILSAWATAVAEHEIIEQMKKSFMTKLTEARRDLALFQHHDAITGTSRQHVVADYGKRLFKSIHDTADVIGQSVQAILQTGRQSHMDLNELPPSYSATETKKVLYFEENTVTNVVIYNSLPHMQITPIRVRVNNPRVKVTLNGNIIPAQINPAFNYEGGVNKKQFELIFIGNLQPLSLTTFALTVTDGQPKSTTVAQLGSLPSEKEMDMIPRQFERIDIDKINPETEENEDNLIMETSQLKTKHDVQTGLLKEVTSKTFGTQAVNVSFWHYKETSSGAYIFNPHGQAVPWSLDKWSVFYVKGPIVSEMHSFLSRIYHSTMIYEIPGTLGQQIHLENIVDLRKMRNDEVVMRISSYIKNLDRKFYTDTNGFHLVKRQFQKGVQFEANYFPMPTAIVLQDALSRLSIVGDHAHGATSSNVGEVEIMLDRILAQDDYKGLGFEPDGLPRDNVPAKSRFTLVLEKKITQQANKFKPSPEHYLYHSLSAHQALQSLLYRPIVLHVIGSPDSMTSAPNSLIGSLPCDYQLLSVRPSLPTDQHRLLILHRTGIDCQVGRVPEICSNGSEDSIVELLKKMNAGSSVEETDLSGLHTKSQTTSPDKITSVISPMDFRVFRFKIGK